MTSTSMSAPARGAEGAQLGGQAQRGRRRGNGGGGSRRRRARGLAKAGVGARRSDARSGGTPADLDERCRGLAAGRGASAAAPARRPAPRARARACSAPSPPRPPPRPGSSVASARCPGTSDAKACARRCVTSQEWATIASGSPCSSSAAPAQLAHSEMRLQRRHTSLDCQVRARRRGQVLVPAFVEGARAQVEPVAPRELAELERAVGIDGEGVAPGAAGVDVIVGGAGGRSGRRGQGLVAGLASGCAPAPDRRGRGPPPAPA